MSLVPFHDLMADAERGGYAVGYFESWNLESLLAVADAAEATCSPVILGFSGIYIPHPERIVRDRLAPYAAMGLAVCRELSVPCCFLFNESPHLDWVFESIELGFNMTMFSDEEMSLAEQTDAVCQAVARAHPAGVAVEAEMVSLPGLSGNLTGLGDLSGLALTDPAAAQAFVEHTGIDALAVNIGQVHLHGRGQVRLDLARLAALSAALPMPLVLHGATSVVRADLAEAARLGIRKINVGSVIKRAYFEALRRAAVAAGDAYNPYDVIGSGFAADVMAAGRVAMQAVVEEMMRLFGSAGKA
jgi:fructose/tagatose bisphosphate aldolase